MSMERQLGELMGEMRGVIARLDRADESRSKLHSRLDDIASDVSQISVEMGTVKEELAAMKPEVEMVRNVRAKAGMAVIVLGGLVAISTWLAATFADEIKNAIVKFFS